MKLFSIIVISIMLIAILPHSLLFSFDESSMKLKDFISQDILSSNTDNDWIASIDGIHISRNEFEDNYQYFQSQIPADQKSKMPGDSDMRKIYLNNMIYQDLVVMEALKDVKTWSPHFDAVLRRMLYQAVYQLYLAEILPKNGFTPTENEINDFYKNNSNSLSLYDNQMKRDYAVKSLSEQKIKQWIYNKIESFKSNRIITNRLE